MRMLRLLPTFSRPRLALWGLLLLLVTAAFSPLAIQQHGLDTARQIGPFLNGTLPPRTPSSTTSWDVEPAFPNLTFVDPIQLLEMPGTNLFLMAGKRGHLWTFDRTNPSTATKTEILNIVSQVKTAGDAGLMGVALHPEFGQAGSPNRGYLYIWYRYNYLPSYTGVHAYLRLSRFTLADGATTINPNTEYVMIQQSDRHDWHNGGGMFFGPDGFLYITVGDEGGAADEYDNGQKINEGLLAGLLRIDVDMDPTRSHPIRRQPISPTSGSHGPMPAGWPASYSQGYYIPNDNPWLDPNGTILEEFYAIGLRSPHRATYDDVTGNIWVGDVGQGAREEVSIINKGDNLQWPYKEGTFNGFAPQPNPLIGTDRAPVYDYSRALGNCVIGGFVYRGSKYPSLQGKYIFGDHGTRNVFVLDYNPGNGAVQSSYLVNVPQGGFGSKSGISAFATDASGEVYILKLFGTNQDGGSIYKLKASTTVPEPPALLSQTGVFQDMVTLDPAPGVIPYGLNVPFWSDAAAKYRWIAIPHDSVDGKKFKPEEQITFSPTGEWQFPIGGVLVKHFEMNMDESNPNAMRRLETRFLVHGDDGNYYGISYRWRADQSDADLLAGGWIDTLAVATPANGNREIAWLYPNRQQCGFCHNAAAGGVLGPKTRQLNGDLFYPETGRDANQIVTMAHLGMFAGSVDTTTAYLNSLPTSVHASTAGPSLEDKARSYLDANCASCHRPGTAVQALFDSRFDTDIDAQGLVYGALFTKLGMADPRVIVPGDLEHSSLFVRLAAVHRDFAMPPLAKNLADTAGIALIEAWINSMSPTQGYASNVIVADYGDDFAGPSPAAGWSYLWNENGPIGNAANYTPMLWANGAYDSDGVPGVPDNSSNLRWGHLNAGGGHTGPAQGQGQATSRFVIAAYTVGVPGTYEIINSNYVDGNGGCGDGAEVRVYVNNSLALTASFPNGGSTPFNTNLGTLQAGDVIYVCAGPGNSNDFCDGFTWDYSILRVQALDGQRVDFPTPAHVKVNAGSVALSATATSGLPVSYNLVSGPATLSGNTLTLTGQPGEIRVQASQPGSGTFAPAPTVERRFWVLPVDKGEGTGLRARYFHDIDTSVLAFERVDPQVDFYWGSGSPDPGMAYNQYAVIWDGEVEAPYSGTYSFTTTTDDGVRLWVNGQLIIDHWQDQEAATFTGNIALTAWQRVPIRLEYYEQGVYAEARLEWSSGSQEQVVIPSQFLYPAQGSSFPVELLSFTAERAGSVVDLNWETASELNASHFVVERSADGLTFDSLLRTQAQGTTTDHHAYQAQDGSPLAGRSYYRLKQVDLDGTFSYSQVVEVMIDRNLIRAFPNPVVAGNPVQVQVDFAFTRPLELQLIDLQGRPLHRESRARLDGRELLTVPTAGLPRGVYLLVLVSGDFRQVEKIVVR